MVGGRRPNNPLSDQAMRDVAEGTADQYRDGGRHVASRSIGRRLGILPSAKSQTGRMKCKKGRRPEHTAEREECPRSHRKTDAKRGRRRRKPVHGHGDAFVRRNRRRYSPIRPRKHSRTRGKGMTQAVHCTAASGYSRLTNIGITAEVTVKSGRLSVPAAPPKRPRNLYSVIRPAGGQVGAN